MIILKSCLGCGVVASWINQYAVSHSVDHSQAILDICSFLPTDFERVCSLAQKLIGPLLDELLSVEGATIDTACHCINL